MNLTQFRRYIDRDGVMYDRGYLDDTAVPQHRRGRGIGGSRLRDVPSNIITFSSSGNGEIEDNVQYRKAAYLMGFTLREGDDPLKVPVHHPLKGWLLLDDTFGYVTALQSVVNEWLQYARNA